MVYVINVFVRTKRLAYHNGHLSCIVIKMLHIFAAAGHHHYAKGARLYCELMKQLKTLPAYSQAVNAERAAEVGMEMQVKLDGQSVTSTMDVKSKIKSQNFSLGQREEDAA